MRNQPKYFKITDDLGVAIILKVGSSSIAKAIIDAHHPDIASIPISFPNDGLGINRPGWQGICPRVADPATILACVREPVERFRSACAQIGVSAEDALTKLEADDWFNPHFNLQSRAVKNATKLYKFPDHLEQFATDASLSYPLPEINESATHNHPKPDLTPEQKARVESVYADDIALFTSISVPGQEYTAPQPPLTPEEIEAAARQKAMEAARALFASLPKGKQALWEPVRLAVENAMLVGDFSSAVEIFLTVPSLYEGMEDERAQFLALFES